MTADRGLRVCPFRGLLYLQSSGLVDVERLRQGLVRAAPAGGKSMGSGAAQATRLYQVRAIWSDILALSATSTGITDGRRESRTMTTTRPKVDFPC